MNKTIMSSLSTRQHIIKYNKTMINKYWFEVFNRLAPLSQTVLFLWVCPLMFFYTSTPICHSGWTDCQTMLVSLIVTCLE